MVALKAIRKLRQIGFSGEEWPNAGICDPFARNDIKRCRS